MKSRRIAPWLLLLTMNACNAVAYETPTHRRLSIASYEASNLSQASLLQRLGVQNLIGARTFISTNQGGDPDLVTVLPTCDPKSLKRLNEILTCGAMYEDVPWHRSFNHFFDPVYGEPLKVNNSFPGISLGFYNMTSPDWALQDNNTVAGQQFSYRRARQYLFNALTTEGNEDAPDGRNRQWVLLFQTIGQIIHHVQDMAQPQHSRNDAHADWFSSVLGALGIGHYRHPSRFEKYSRLPRGVSKIEEAIALALPPVYPRYESAFAKPRQFWVDSQVGMARYSNSNFVTQGTNFTADTSGVARPNKRFALPVPIETSAVGVVEAFAPSSVPTGVIQLCELIGISNCKMNFYANEWIDPLTGEPAMNARASTASIFDEDLNVRSITYSGADGAITTTRLFALNRLNFDASYPFLIPRAVAYSAGLINYFFRGEMEISLPADGIYALVDHHAQRCIDNCGFDKVKLKLKNTTPNEAMTAGSLYAVAKFHRNSCYKDDLSGDPGGPAFLGMSCRSLQEEIVVSQPVALAALAANEEREFSFAFPQRIPINASDLYLQVVFKGTLGQEVDAVAVTTKDIAEPNYFAFTNVTDYVYDFPGKIFRAVPTGAYSAPDSIHSLSVAFKASASPLATLANLSAPGHAQLAFLTDPGTQYLDIRYASPRYTVGSPIRGTIPVSEFVSPPDSGLYGRSVIFTRSRGMYRDFYEYHRYPVDFTAHDCNIEKELCAQTTLPPLLPATAVEWTINF